MKRRVLIICLCVMASVLSAQNTPAAKTEKTTATQSHKAKSDSIYQGTFVKLDLFNPVYSLARSKGKMTEAEVAVSVRLLDRLYPTLEGGMLYGTEASDTTTYLGRGGFGRIGLDINPLKKSRKSPHAMLIGIRLGTAFQDYDLQASHIKRWDAWGEIATGCQANMVSGFYMGWTARLKVLFTLKQKTTATLPYYIPGFGKADTMGWGIDYYLGWRF